MKNKFIKSTTLLAVTMGMLSTVNAALYDRGNGMIYDSEQNLTWLQDANYVVTSGYAAANAVFVSGNKSRNNVLTDGRMGWDAAQTWVSGLTVGGFNDWRLATVTDRAMWVVTTV